MKVRHALSDNHLWREAAGRKLGRIHQIARYVLGIPCRAPDFLIVGAQKGGTTSLYSYLAQHPNIIPPVRKEVHFFENPVSRAKGGRWYRSFFPTELYLGYKEWRVGGDILTCEGTTYMPYPRIPKMLQAINPAAKLIFLLRNPVDRAFSHYMHICRSYPGLEPLTFGDAIRAEAQRIQPDIDALSRNEWHDDRTFRAFSYVRTGMYAEHLKRWLDFFPRENTYIGESERFFRHPALVLQEINSFLKLPDHQFDVAKQFNVGGHTDDIHPTDRAFLVKVFADDRAELQKMLGRDFGAAWF